MVMWSLLTMRGTSNDELESCVSVSDRLSVTGAKRTTRASSPMPPTAVMTTLNRLWPQLEAHGIIASVAGGLALSFWGHPRSTHDVDLAIHAADRDSGILPKAIQDVLSGLRFRLAAARPLDLGLFTIHQWAYDPEDEFVRVKVDLMISGSDFYQAAAARAVQVELSGADVPIRVLSLEDLVLHKLYAWRLIDRADVVTLLELHRDQFDRAYLEYWVNQLSLEEAWNEVLGEVQ